MERKVDEAAGSCLRYHTALCRTPGRGTQAGLGQEKLIHTVQGHESIPLPPRSASKPPPSCSRDRDLPYPTLSNLFGWPESSSRTDAQHSPISTLRSLQAGLGVSHFEARSQTVLGNSAAPDSRCPLCCRVR